MALALGGGSVHYASIRRPYGQVTGDAVLPPSRPEDPEKFQRFRVASFNIHSGRGATGPRDLSKTAAELAGVDLAALNEVRGPSLFGGPDMATDLGARLGMASAFGPAERRWFFASFGNGILSKFPILSWRSDPMSAGHAKSYRAVITAEVAIGARTVRVCVVHAERGELNDEQLIEATERFAAMEPPALLLGDLNARLGHPLLTRIGALPGVVEVTAADPTPGRSRGHIQHIYAKGFRVLDADQFHGTASDHGLMWADLELPLE